MNENELSQFNPTCELADSHDEAVVGVEKEGISPEEVRKQLEQNTISKYRKLLDAINSSLKDGNITQDQYDKSILDIDNLSKKELGYKFTERDIKFRKELIVREEESLRRFFGKEVKVNPIPSEITPERYVEWKEKELELYFLPDIDMTKGKNFPGLKVGPQDWFYYEEIKKGRLPKDSTKLLGRWILIDTRTKPAYNDGNQMYKNDILGPAIKELREKGLIQSFKIKDSRFDISKEELEKPEVKEAFAKALGINPHNFRVPRAIEFNFIGNCYYPEWGGTDTREWFDDIYDSTRRLSGGFSGVSGLADVCSYDADVRHDIISFRPLGVF